MRPAFLTRRLDPFLRLFLAMSIPIAFLALAIRLLNVTP